MARPANPNKEKISAIKTELKDLNRTVKQGESASKKIEKLEERLAKFTGDTPVKSSKVKPATKVAKADKTDKKAGKKKVDTKAEKKSGKVVTQAKKTRGRPRKVEDDSEDD